MSFRPDRETSFLERHHVLTFLAVVAVGLSLTTLGVRSPERVERFGRLGLALGTPLARVGSAISGGLSDAWEGVSSTWTARRELEALRTECRDLRLLLAEREEAVAENARLRDLLDLSERVPWRVLPARVVFKSREPDRVLVIDRGSEDGVVEDQAVIAPMGVVGKVLDVGARTARVQCVVDADAGVAVMVGDERRQADAIVADGGGGLARLRHLDAAEGLQPGDRVLTSGLDEIYPRGLLVGVVESVEGEAGIDQEALVRPAVDFARLEEVLVVAGERPKAAPPKEAPRKPGPGARPPGVARKAP